MTGLILETRVVARDGSDPEAVEADSTCSMMVRLAFLAALYAFRSPAGRGEDEECSPEKTSCSCFSKCCFFGCWSVEGRVRWAGLRGGRARVRFDVVVENACECILEQPMLLFMVCRTCTLSAMDEIGRDGGPRQWSEMEQRAERAMQNAKSRLSEYCAKSSRAPATCLLCACPVLALCLRPGKEISFCASAVPTV